MNSSSPLSPLPPVKLSCMKFRKLRIAWSVAWGTLAVSLCGLWTRSDRWLDTVIIQGPSNGYFELQSFNGKLLSSHLFGNKPLGYLWHHWSDKMLPDERRAGEFGGVGFGTVQYPFGTAFSLPYWFLTLASALLAATPWLRFRFSLRTLL